MSEIQKRRLAFYIAALVFCLGGMAARVLADGFIIPHPPRPGDVVPPLTVKYHHVKVEIRDQVAKTTIDQVFINNFNRDIEGTYIFPLPEQASISEFAMWIGDKRVEGEILDSQQARRIYEDIVRRMRDPAILEYIGRNIFRARVYPIPAMGEKRIQMSYSEVLRAEKNFVRYRYPLNTEQFSYKPIQDVSVSVKIASQTPISNIYSPSHKVSVRKEGEREATASFEETNTRPDKDFFLYYSFSQDDVGLSFINWAGDGAKAGAGADAGADERYFMLLASPRYTTQRERVINKNLIFALDSSGSMSGTKIKQAKEAARFIINHLDENDRFSIIDFDDGVSLFSQELVGARPANRDKALKFVDEIQDSGGTNINEALLKALKMTQAGERPNYIVFLTDGLPTVGVTETAQILKNIGAGNETKSRIFVFGVGNDVNTELLDKIASENRGTSVYVGESEDLEVAISSYFEKIASPLLADLKLVFKGIEVQGVYPRALPDLFKGSQLVMIGKYTGEGPVTAILSGKVGKADKQFVIESVKLTKENTYNFLPRLWATRRIGYLLEEIRLHGAAGSGELVDEVKKLGLKYGIVTPYTSFLVTERERLRIDAAAPEAQAAFEAKQVSGAGAVRVAKATQALKAQDLAPMVASEQIRYKDDKTFYLKGGVWVDSLYKEGAALKEIKFNSDDYYKLLAEKPGLGKYIAVGTKIIVCFEGTNYKITE